MGKDESLKVDRARRAVAIAVQEMNLWRMARRIAAAQFFAFTVATVWACCGLEWGMFSGALASGIALAWCWSGTAVAVGVRDTLMRELKEAEDQQQQS